MKLSFHFMIQEFKMESLKFTILTKTITFHISVQANLSIEKFKDELTNLELTIIITLVQQL